MLLLEILVKSSHKCHQPKSKSKAASQQPPVFTWTDAPIQPQVHQYTGVSDQMSFMMMERERELLGAVLYHVDLK